MIRFMLRRLVLGVFVIWAVASITFFAIHTSGDPITTGLQESGATPDQIAEIKDELGFNRPLVVQYGSFLSDSVQGDFGNSFVYGSSAEKIVMDRLPNTLRLAAVALVLSVALAIPLGLAGAYFEGRFVDRLVGTFTVTGQSVPSFVIGPLLILLFAVTWKVLPAAGADGWKALILPALTLSLYPTSRVTRMMRTSSLRVMQLDYVNTARSKGVSELAVAHHHVARNSMISVLTLLGLEVSGLIGGAVVTENIFGWPGIGTLARESFSRSDYPIAQLIVIMVATIVVIVSLLTDLAYSLVDPRIRVR